MRIPARFSEHPLETVLAGALLLLLLLGSAERNPGNTAQTAAPTPANQQKL